MLGGALGFYDVQTRLLAAIDAALAGTIGGRVDRVGVVPGAIAWDECECGTLAASITRHWLSDNFPAEQTTTPCDAAYLVADVSIALVRCAPQPQGDALAPTTSALDGAAQVTISDAYTVMTTVSCKLDQMMEAYEIAEFLVRDQTYVGPGGACVGSELHVTIGLLRGVT